MVTGSRQTQTRHTSNKATYITSAPMVLAYALAGNVQVDLEHESLSSSSQNVSIRDLWPTREEVEAIEDESITKKVLREMDEKIQVNIK